MYVAIKNFKVIHAVIKGPTFLIDPKTQKSTYSCASFKFEAHFYSSKMCTQIEIGFFGDPERG